MSGKTTANPEDRALAIVLINTLNFIVKWLKRRYNISE